MASLKELRDRIGSVKSTQKITRAMQMVAAAKLRRAQESANQSRSYTQNIAQMVTAIAHQVEEVDASDLVRGTGKDQTHLLVVCTTDRGLCGSFNTHIIKKVTQKIKLLQLEGRVVKILTVGRKGAELLSREYGDLIIERLSFRDIKQLRYEHAKSVSNKIVSLFRDNEFDVCSLFYSKFVSVLVQEPVDVQLIPARIAFLNAESQQQPVDNTKSEELTLSCPDMLDEYEPDAITVLNNLMPKKISADIFQALLENIAGEMSSKMRAMDNATRNAGDMIQKLSVSYNRQRQAQITTELIEIIAGAEAL